MKTFNEFRVEIEICIIDIAEIEYDILKIISIW